MAKGANKNKEADLKEIERLWYFYRNVRSQLDDLQKQAQILKTEMQALIDKYKIKDVLDKIIKE